MADGRITGPRTRNDPPVPDDWGTVVRPVDGATETTLLAILAQLIACCDGGAFGPTFTGTNGEAVPLVSGMPVAQPGAVLLEAVNSSGFARANVVGLVVLGNDPTLPVVVLPRGVLTLPTATWDAVTGAVGGLVSGARYYLGGALATLTTTAPVTVGDYVTIVGSALSAVTMLLDPQPPILL